MTEIQKELNIERKPDAYHEKRKLENSNDTLVSKKCCYDENQENEYVSSKEGTYDFQQNNCKTTKEKNSSSDDDRALNPHEEISFKDTKKSLANVEDENSSSSEGSNVLQQNNEISTTGTKENDTIQCNEENKSSSPILFNGQDVRTLSKSQMKKYKKMLSWEANKKEKRRKEKMRAKQRKIEARKNNISIGPSRKELKKSKMCYSSCKTGVVIDLSFDDLMIPKDIGKVVKQILRVYTENRRSKTPMQLHLTSFDGKSKEEMSKNDGYENWDCHFHPEDYIDIFPKDKLVYLSSESDNVIKELEQDKLYIIGGLVDHNQHKGLCYKKAVEQGIQHGQLPISEFFTIKTRKVFTINQVFEILLRVSEGLTFKEAFEKVLPQRINLIPTEVAEKEESI